jgi:hypothetical protein
MAKMKPAKKKKAPANRSRAKKKAVVKKKAATSKKLALKKKIVRRPVARNKRPRGKQEVTETVTAAPRRGLGSASGGQSGDTQGLSTRAIGDSESVTELEEEGQYFEAEAVRGVESAPDPDQGEVRTHEVPEDDVPEEYDEKETDTD